MPLWNIVDYN